jgi:hypothetical protein
MSPERAAKTPKYEHSFYIDCFEQIAQVANIYECSYEPFKNQMPYPNTKIIIMDSELRTINSQLDTLTHACKHLD